MASNSSWEPTNRASWWRNCDDWCKNIGTGDNVERWRVPLSMYERLCGLRDDIRDVETTPTNYRTKNITKQLSDLYDELKKLMRNIKRMCFMTPPLTSADYIALGLKEPDNTPTNIEVPKAIPLIEVSNAGGLHLKFVVKPESESAEDKRADYGVQLRACIVPRGEVSGKYSVQSGVVYKTDGDPKSYHDLNWNMFTRKKRFNIVFDAEDRAGLLYYSARYENSKGQGGPWSKIDFAVIA